MTSSNKKRLKVRVPPDGDWSDYWESSTITQQSADNESKNMFLCYLMMFPGCENMSFTPFAAGFLVIFRLDLAPADDLKCSSSRYENYCRDFSSNKLRTGDHGLTSYKADLENSV